MKMPRIIQVCYDCSEMEKRVDAGWLQFSRRSLTLGNSKLLEGRGEVLPLFFYIPHLNQLYLHTYKVLIINQYTKF